MKTYHVGLVVLPPHTESSSQVISKCIREDNVLSNYPFGAPHMQLSFSSQPSTAFCLNIPVAQSSLSLHHPISKYASIVIEISKRVDKLLIVAPGPKIPLIYVLLAHQLGNIQMSNIRLLIGNVLYNEQQIHQLIQKADKRILQHQWQLIQDDAQEPLMQAANTDVKPSHLLKTPSGATLRPYQQQMVDFAIKNKRVGLFVDMGLGKTLATLATLSELVRQHRLDPTRPVLIVAPITVALDTWAREAEKWQYDMDVKINIRLSVKKRQALLDDIAQPQSKLTLLTTNPAQLKSILSYFIEHRCRPPFQAVIVDELSQFKSPKAQRFNQLSKLTASAEYFLGLTGTPSPNNLLDIWSQMISIDAKNKQRFGYNFFQYRDKFFMPDIVNDQGIVYSYKLKPDVENDIYQLMKPTVISMRSEGLIDLPDLVYDNRYVKLPSKAMDLYNKMDTQLRQAINEQEHQANPNDEDENITLQLTNTDVQLANTAVLTGKLAQLSSGAIYEGVLDVDAKSQKYEIFHNAKLEALQDIVNNTTSPILVFFYFKSELDRMSKYFDYEYLNPHADNFRDIISRWNAGKIPVLVAHPASAGHGLNLQDGGHTIVWLTTTWSNEQYRQANKRIYRSGQTHSVSIIHIIAEDTIDEEIIQRLDNKEESQSRLMTALDVAHRSK